MIVEKEIFHFHMPCGIGGGAIGFNKASARVGNLKAKFVCVGGLDVDPAACRDFERLTGAPATCLDLMDRAQYKAFHGREPPPEWREAVPADIRRACGGKRPHIFFGSFPCKGFSGLLSEKASQSAKYGALNGLTTRGMWLFLEEFKDDPVELIVFENVPRIATRGRWLLDQICALLRSYGYAVAETTHDCGELGGLAQSRKRYLLVARYMPKVPNFLYEPIKRRLRGVGEVLDKLPLPLSGLGGPMHRMPALQWKTWVRLAFVEAGSDWRSLDKLNVQDGVLTEFGIVPDYGYNGMLGVTAWDQPSATVSSRGLPTNGHFAVADPRNPGSPHHGCHGVQAWDDPAHTVTSASRPVNGTFAVADPRFDGQPRRSTFGVHGWAEPSGVIGGETLPSNGAFAVSDPRVDGHPKSVQLGVRPWDQPAGVITGKMYVGGGPHSVADPRLEGRRFNHVFRIVKYDAPAPAVSGPGGAGGLAVADPRAPDGRHKNGKYRVTGFDEPANAVIAGSTTGNGAFVVADPRYEWQDGAHQNKMAVRAWEDPAKTVTGSDRVGSGAQSVADPRLDYGPSTHHHALKVTPWNEPSGTVTTSRSAGSGALSVADPRTGYGDDTRKNVHRVTPWEEPAGTVTSGHSPSNGALSVADPRPRALSAPERDAYLTGGHYGVVDWQEPTRAVPGFAKNNNGPWSVADPRHRCYGTDAGAVGHNATEKWGEYHQPALPAANERLVCVIQALDKTWHRPFTTLELAAIQSLIDPDDFLELDGLSDSAWRERIGNMVPPDAAEAMGGVLGRCLLGAWSGETFSLSAEKIWVRDVAVGLMAAQ